MLSVLPTTLSCDGYVWTDLVGVLLLRLLLLLLLLLWLLLPALASAEDWIARHRDLWNNALDSLGDLLNAESNEDAS